MFVSVQSCPKIVMNRKSVNYAKYKDRCCPRVVEKFVGYFFTRQVAYFCRALTNLPSFFPKYFDMIVGLDVKCSSGKSITNLTIMF